MEELLALARPVRRSTGVKVIKIFWPQMDVEAQKQCLDSIYRGFLSNTDRNIPDIQDELLQAIELSDALKTTSYGYSTWSKGNSTKKEQKLPGFDGFDDDQNMIMVFGTLFCNREGALPGSPYEAVMNAVASNTRSIPANFRCSNNSAIYNRRLCV
ncbi:hypothetical protein RB195_001927 [Necator americanus]|uniref:Peptidase M13 C-terminal domain-containing protein n=2 Tax=Necator americanus TaxID=51031 RepID=A0ABR1DI29_NECAM